METTTVVNSAVIAAAFAWQQVAKKFLEFGKSGGIFSTPTGTGKSHVVIEEAARRGRILYIAPTRELCREMARRLQDRLGRKNVLVLNRDHGFNTVAAQRVPYVVGSYFALAPLMKLLGNTFSERFPVVFLDELDQAAGSQDLELLLTEAVRKAKKTRFFALSGSIHENDLKPLSLWLRARKIIHNNARATSLHNHTVRFQIVKDKGQSVQTEVIVTPWDAEGKPNEVTPYRLNFEISANDHALAAAEVLRYIREVQNDPRPTLAFTPRQAPANDLARYLLNNLPPWLRNRRPEMETHLEDVAGGDSPEVALFRECLPYGFVPHHGGINRGCRILAQSLCVQGQLDLTVGCYTKSRGTNEPYGSAVFFTARDPKEKGPAKLLSASDFHQVAGRVARPQYYESGNIFVVVHDRITEIEVARRLFQERASEINPVIDNVNKLAPYVVSWVFEGFNTRGKLLKCMQRTFWARMGATREQLYQILDSTIEELLTEFSMLEREKKRLKVTEWGSQLGNMMVTPIELDVLRNFTVLKSHTHNEFVEICANLKQELSPDQGQEAWDHAVDDVVAYGLNNHRRVGNHRLAGQLADYCQRMADLGFIYLKNANAEKHLLQRWARDIASLCLHGVRSPREALRKLSHPMRKRLLRECGDIINTVGHQEPQWRQVIRVAFAELPEAPNPEWIKAIAEILFISEKTVAEIAAEVQGTELGEKPKEEEKKKVLRGGGASASSQGGLFGNINQLQPANAEGGAK